MMYSSLACPHLQSWDPLRNARAPLLRRPTRDQPLETDSSWFPAWRQETGTLYPEAPQESLRCFLHPLVCEMQCIQFCHRLLNAVSLKCSWDADLRWVSPPSVPRTLITASTSGWYSYTILLNPWRKGIFCSLCPTVSSRFKTVQTHAIFQKIYKSSQ